MRLAGLNSGTAKVPKYQDGHQERLIRIGGSGFHDPPLFGRGDGVKSDSPRSHHCQHERKGCNRQDDGGHDEVGLALR